MSDFRSSGFRDSSNSPVWFLEFRAEGIEMGVAQRMGCQSIGF